MKGEPNTNKKLKKILQTRKKMLKLEIIIKKEIIISILLNQNIQMIKIVIQTLNVYFKTWIIQLRVNIIVDNEKKGKRHLIFVKNIIIL